MLRQMSTGCVRRCAQGLLVNGSNKHVLLVRFNSTGGAAKSGFSRSFFLLTGTSLVAGTGGAIYYVSQKDPILRSKVEDMVPFMKDVFLKADNWISVGSDKFATLNETKDEIAKKLPKKKPTPAQETSGADKPLDLSSPKKSKTEPSPNVDPAAATALKPIVDKDAETRRQINTEDATNKRLNTDLEERMKAAITAAENKVAEALKAKQATATTIDHHAKLIRDAVDQPKDSTWGAVADAAETVRFATDKDFKVEATARNYLDMLNQVINNGRSVVATASNPLLINAKETLNDLKYKLDEAVSLVEHSKTEQQITTEFKQLVEKGRQQFSRELKDILPHVDIHAKDNKLTETELNALIAHAHLRVDQLRKQLTEQQLREEQRIEDARKRQQAEDNRFAEQQRKLDTEHADVERTVAIERQFVELQEEAEAELRAQLRRAAAAHSEHLEEVLTVQRAQFDETLLLAVDSAVDQERRRFHEQLSLAMQRLSAIEVALESRAVQDLENRRSKELWLACQNLLESVVHGRKGALLADTRRKPLANELMTIKEVSENNPFVNTLINAICDEALAEGVYTEADLRSRFNKMRRLASRTALIGDDGGSLLLYFVSFLQSLVVFDFWKKYQDAEVETISNPESIDTFAVLSRAKYYINEKDDLESAIRLLQLLRGEPGRVASDWIADARRHLETRQTARLLLAHAGASSLRTVY